MRVLRSTTPMVVLTAIYVSTICNIGFFKHITTVYPLAENGSFLVSLLLLQSALITFFLAPFAYRKIVRPICLGLIFFSAVASFFITQYGIVMDQYMMNNLVETNQAELTELISPRLVLWMLVVFGFPTLLAVFVKIDSVPVRQEIITTFRVTSLSLLVIIANLFLFSSTYTGFFREHKILRYYSNPTAPIYSLTVSMLDSLRDATGDVAHQSIFPDARVSPDGRKPRLIVFVVGETVRYDSLSLNGYQRETTPMMNKHDMLSFKSVEACGTSTAVSVPCMFSVMTQSEFNIRDAFNQDNILDVLQHAGINVLWRDNNSSSKGVALRIPYEDFKHSSVNTVCDEECRDVGMLEGLAPFLAENSDQDHLLILHAKGNHGPAYYKRYPSEFAYFSPSCQTNDLSGCSSEEIRNAYDNAVRYTDYFIDRTISFLQTQSATYATGLIYVADHGESLGEHGIYLHGLPRVIAPEEQLHVPVLMWFADDDIADRTDTREQLNFHFSHDDVFPTLMDIFDIETSTTVAGKSMIRHRG